MSGRLGWVPFSPAAEQAIEVSLAQAGGLWTAKLELRARPGIIQGQRTLAAQGSDCAALADATTLAIALAIDPEASLESTGAEAPPTFDPAPQPPPPCPITRCPAPAPCPACAPTPIAEVIVSGSLRGVLTGGMLPGPAPGIELTTELGTQGIRGQLGVLYLPETSAGDARFSFGLTTASAGLSGALRLTRELELSACGQVQLGAIYAVVDELQPLETGDQPWLAFAGGPRLRLHAVGPLLFELGGSVIVPLLDHSFEVLGIDSPVYEGGPVGGLGFVGVGFRAP